MQMPKFCSRKALRGGSKRLAPMQAVAGMQSGSSRFSVPVKEFEAPNGTIVQVLDGDYGFRSGANRMYDEQYGEVPGSIFQLAVRNFLDEWQNMRSMFVNDEFRSIAAAKDSKNILNKVTLWLGGKFVRGAQVADDALVNITAMKPVKDLNARSPPDAAGQIQMELDKLNLDDHKVAQREKERFAADPPNAPLLIKAAYHSLCFLLDTIYEGRPIQRFWVLEEVARMPYFAYISILHLYESLGWWRAGAALRKVHFAEEWNELHHLQIMESLGGDKSWFDRFVAQHSAILYYWFLILFYAVSPKQAYLFSDLVEGHAMDTYTEFFQQNTDVLKSLPPPAVAVKYYLADDVYMFESFQISGDCLESPRRPDCNSLYEVFVNIRDDEIEHKKTMKACQSTDIAKDIANANNKFSN
eukprot:jgi/Ulvmu1/7801/UM004_0030.1